MATACILSNWFCGIGEQCGCHLRTAGSRRLAGQEVRVGSDVTAASRRTCGHHPTWARRDISRELDRSWASPRRSAGPERVNGAANRARRTWWPMLCRYAAAHPGVALARICLLLPDEVWDSCFMPAEYPDRTGSIAKASAASRDIRSLQEPEAQGL